MALSDQTYAALQTAAHRIAEAEYTQGLAAHVKAGRKKHTYRHTPSQAHRDVVEMLGSHTATDEEAMGLLHEYDVLKARTQKVGK